MTAEYVRRPARRLVLCFDGTGNHFEGDASDTNVVKIFEMLERNDEDQFKYYQPGIGTFDMSPRRQTFMGRLREKVRLKADQALGSSFEYHVSAGYEFLMDFFSPGDAIYIFGFSRGAYTARFLAEMINEVGLLSQGNQEMIRFAFDSFSKVLNTRGKPKKSAADVRKEKYLEKFKRTFCRPGAQVYFLGIFDCVNSVGQFEVPFRRTSYRYIAKAPAKHIRHAVSIHERRLKFKPALFVLDDTPKDSDIREVYFAGNHRDVGGGYPYESSKIKHLISDVPLAWMIDEVNALEDQPAGKLDFDTGRIERSGHLDAGRDWYQEANGPETDATRRAMGKELQLHDSLKYNRGSSPFSTTFWWILEILPLFTRLELERGEWVPRYWPPNFGASRDLPHHAQIHESVQYMHNVGIVPEMPDLGGDSAPVLDDPLIVPRVILKKLVHPLAK